MDTNSKLPVILDKPVTTHKRDYRFSFFFSPINFSLTPLASWDYWWKESETIEMASLSPILYKNKEKKTHTHLRLSPSSSSSASSCTPVARHTARRRGVRPSRISTRRPLRLRCGACKHPLPSYTRSPFPSSALLWNAVRYGGEGLICWRSWVGGAALRVVHGGCNSSPRPDWRCGCAYCAAEAAVSLARRRPDAAVVWIGCGKAYVADSDLH